MRAFLLDVRFALRGLARNPGFAAGAAATLALGIGASVAVFSIVDASLLRPLPYRAPDALVRLGTRHPVKNPDGLGASYPDFLDWRSRARSFQSMAGILTGSAVLGGEGEASAVRVPAAWVSWDLSRTLGLPLLAGRALDAGEDREGGDSRVALLTAGLWASRFGSDPGVVGRKIRIEGVPHVVVGVVGGDSLLLEDAGVLLPLVQQAFTNRSGRPIDVVARLAPGAGAQAARAEMEAIGRALQREYPESNAGFDAAVRPLAESLLGGRRPALLMLSGSVALLLLIACANVAGLLLARGASRSHELARRAALGAGVSRLARQLLTESLALAAIGGAGGLLAAGALLSAIRGILPDAQRLAGVSVDLRVAGFAAAASAAAALVFGLAPALASSRRAIAAGLGSRTRGAAGRSGALDGIVVVQAALSVVLLVGAGLLARTYLALSRADTGVRADGVATLRLSLPSAAYPDGPARAAFLRRALDGVSALPGVRASGVAGRLPGQASMTVSYTPEGHPRLSRARSPQAEVRAVSAGTLPALGVPVLEGRGISDSDDADAPPVIVVNHRLAARLWPGGSALGRHVTLFSDGIPRRVVGVVRDVARVDGGLTQADQLYTPYAQDRLLSAAVLVVRTAGDPMRVAPEVERRIAAIDPGVAVSDARTMSALLAAGVAEPRFRMSLVAAFAAAALLLAGVGLYGVVAYGAARRRREVGIRIALGASRASIHALLVGRALRLAALGTAAGAIAAIPAARLVAGLLYGVRAADWATYAAAAGALLAVSAAAALVPSRRAARTDPLSVLAAE